jgi:hypothetical protein
MRFPKLILTTAFLFTFHRAPLPDPDLGLGPAACLGVRVLWSGTLTFNNRSGYLYYMEHRLKSDLSALFQIAQEIVKETRINSRSADYKQVSRAANRIRKLANRIKSGLTLGNLPVEEKGFRETAPQTLSPELLRSKVDELNLLVYKIRQNAVRRSRHVIDARLQRELYAEVDTLETLALRVKVSADELMLNRE